MPFLCLWNLQVSIHAPTRGATTFEDKLGALAKVSIHAPTRGATLHTCNITYFCQGFNPRTHTGCDISSPTTLQCMYWFQSTHPHGVRLSGQDKEELLSEFQSTHPHGVRPVPGGSHRHFPRVSIHAPTRGATSCNQTNTLVNTMFQSTHPHGVRQLITLLSQKPYCFNPRTHTGCDKTEPPALYNQTVSIHAPTRGATYR